MSSCNYEMSKVCFLWTSISFNYEYLFQKLLLIFTTILCLAVKLLLSCVWCCLLLLYIPAYLSYKTLYFSLNFHLVLGTKIFWKDVYIQFAWSLVNRALYAVFPPQFLAILCSKCLFIYLFIYLKLIYTRFWTAFFI